MKILLITLVFQFNIDKSIYEWFLRQRHEDKNIPKKNVPQKINGRII